MKTKALLTLTLLLSAFFSKAQPCSIDPYFQDSVPGIYGNLPTAYAGQDYSGVLFIVTDTLNTMIPNGYYVTYSRICSINNLPDGFTYTANYNNGDNWTNNGTFPDWDPLLSCIIITAPAQAVNNALGVYNEFSIPIVIKIDECISDDINQTPCYWAGSYNGCKSYEKQFHFSAATGITENNTHAFSLGNSYPNPAFGQIAIPFSTPQVEKVSLKIYNQLGQQVYQSSIEAAIGKNQFLINTATFSAGLYSYTISNAKQAITDKLVVE